MAKTLSKDEILGAADRDMELVQVPEWGGAVHVRSISANERGRIEADLAAYKEGRLKDNPVKHFNVRLAAMSMCDEQGNLLFGQADVEKLAEKSARAIARVARVAQRKAGLTKADLETLEKNSNEAQPDDLATD